MPDTKAISRRTTAKARHGGRPRAADVDKLNQDILTAAGELFMENGFDGTSMDAIAEKARISKRTLYLRHADKSALFNSVMYDLLGRSLVPLELIQYELGDLNSVLLAIARDMVTGVVRPEFLAVYRLVSFEANRRPEFGRWIYEVRRRPAVQVIATVLQRHRDELCLTDFERAAEQFMSLTVDVAVRLGTFGMKIASGEMEDQLKAAVDLFLNGARRHGTRDQSISRRSKVAP
jgi:TetR/AcrR family transcriptional regulator, mexJK operon transcriptional repressor